MGYVRQSTDNPLGWRPWNSRLSGLGVAIPRARPVLIPRRIPRRRRFLLGQDVFGATPTGGGTITDTMGAAQTDQAKSQATGILAQLRQVNQQITSLENLVSQSGTGALGDGGALAAAIGPGVAQARDQYTSLASQFVQAYSFLFGAAPSGVEGLGQVMTVGITAVLAILATVVAGLLILRPYVESLLAKAQAKVLQQQNQQTAITGYGQAQQGYNDAMARGDTAAAAAYLQQMNQYQSQITATGAAPETFTHFLQNNWIYVAIAVGGLLVVNKRL